MIPVRAPDLPRARAALDRVAEGPIFLQSNLARYGIGGDAPRAVRLWRNAGWTALCGLTNHGVLMPQMRDATPADWAALPDALAGQRMVGMNGAAPQIARCLEVLDLPPPQLDRTEPCFALELSALALPPHDGLTLAAPRDADLPLLTDWRAYYRAEIMAEPPAAARASAERELPAWLAEDGLRLLWRGGEPVGLTGINARHQDLVQVGAVYTPPPLRGQGFARTAVALHLAELHQTGARRAFLFAASDAAASAYRAIGFAPAGQMRLVILPGEGVLL